MGESRETGKKEAVVRWEEEEEIKMHEDKLGGNTAQNAISGDRLMPGFISFVNIHRGTFIFAVPSLYLCIITKQKQMPG